MTLKFLLQDNQGNFVEANQRYETYPGNTASIELIPTEIIVPFSNLEYLTTKTIIDKYYCGNPIHSLVRDEGERIKADYVITEQETQSSGREHFIAATFFRLKRNSP